jgi:type IV pilus assembly protein PilA
MRHYKNKGFTLVEIMIVVTLIGLLAAMAIPLFQTSRIKAVGKTLANDARQLASASQQYMLQYATTEVIVTIDADGNVSSPLNDIVRRVAKGTVGPGSISMGETFSLSHPQFESNASQIFTPEGRPE